MNTKETKEPVNMDEHQEDSLVNEMGSDINEASHSAGEQPTTNENTEENAIVVELQRQVDDNHSRYLRAQADFDNFRRRTLKEKEEITKYASLKLITELLPVMDNFQRALQTEGESTESEAFVKGVDMIYRQLSQVLESEGLKPMEAVGQPFDPEMHQAIMTVETDEYEEGIVVEAIQNGYWLKDKVIRPAMVKVSG
ncbi:nucleotide exchange factor GrpE [Cohnella sp. WQ 127256]|uniref:nucleotide exchange factor GrpE n=1 Tax=Cohnella sp. WQ 127256 TaxID=2938790 RepID=UPI0021175EA7|nr:nucleotide exchange factor GrpE [Cohnella sp. WQ 127256]